MTKEEKIKRGEDIIKQLEIDADNYKDRKKQDYAQEVLHAFSPFTYDAHFSREEIAIALAEADEQGKKIDFVPDMDREVVIEGRVYKTAPIQCDGWKYKIVIV